MSVVPQQSREAFEPLATFLGLVNTSHCTNDLINSATAFFKELTGLDAIGVRLRKGHDYPYYETRGFPPEFVSQESSLCTLDQNGIPLLDENGIPVLECMCGNVIRGRFDNAKPFFTAKGSFWTNSTTALLESTSDADRQALTRIHCNKEGYESVALIPLRVGDEQLGLLQLNDKRKGCFQSGQIGFIEQLADQLAIALSRFIATEAVEQSEQRYRGLIEQAADGIFLSDHKGCYVEVNTAGCKMTGYSRDEILGLTIADLVGPKGTSRIDRGVDGVSGGQVIQSEWQFRRKDGSCFTGEIRGRQLPDGCLQSIVRDVTERRKTEQVIERAKQEWEQTFDSVPDLICILDRDQRIIRANQALVDRMGATWDACIGQKCHDCIHPDNQPPACPFMLTLADGQHHSVEVHDNRWNTDFMISTSPVFDSEGQILSIVHVARDITAQKRADALEREALALDFASQAAMDILESMGEGVVLIGIDGKMLSMNPAIEKMTGMSAGDLIGKLIQHLLPDILSTEDHRHVLIALSALLNGQTPTMPPIALRRPGREPVHAMLSLSLVRGMANEPKEIVLTLRDISELHDTQESLKETNTILEQIFNNTQLAIAYLDRDFNFIRVNRSFADAYQCPQDELQGKNYFELHPHPQHQQPFKQVAETGVPYDSSETPLELRHIPGKRTTYWDWSLRPLLGDAHDVESLLFCMSNVTERMRARQKLTESERKYRELVENANSIIMRVSPEHHITFFNEYAQTFFGYSETDVLGKSVFKTITPETDTEGRDNRALLADITAHPEMHASNENENICKDGRRVWVHWANRAIRDTNGKIIEILCVGTDITERKLMQEQAVRYQQRLRDLAERLASTEEQNRWRISRYIHDTIVQNLALSHIHLCSVAKRFDGDPEPTVSQKLEAARALINEAIDECRTVISDLTPPLLYELGLSPALKDFARHLTEKHGTHIYVEHNGQDLDLLPTLRGLLFESTRELIMNALKHAGPCKISVRTSYHVPDGRLEIRVPDTGRGFDPTVSDIGTSEHHGGFGTFSIRQRIEGLGGDLQITSAFKKGTTATIRLPIEPTPDSDS